MGECLIAKRAEVDENCQVYVDINQACGSAMERCGDGIQWGSDAILCVTQWTRKDDLSADCADALLKLPEDKPAAEPEVSEEESEASKKKREKRKAARKRAANDVRGHDVRGYSAQTPL